MPSRNINCLKEPFKSLILKWLTKCLANGVEVVIYETCRTKQEQEVYYMQGREPLEKVNEARKKIGLKPISASENRMITWTKDSPHLYGLAIDFVPTQNGKPLWNRYDLFEKAGKIAEELGLEWGGRWKEKDYPHIQLPNWKAYRGV